MRPVTVTVGPLATASANAVCLSQTPTTTFTINGSLASGGVATLDTPRRILFTTTSASDNGKVVTLTGTDISGNTITELLTLVNANSVTTAYTNLDYATVSAISISAAASGAMTVGTNNVASSMWVRLDEWASPSTSIQVTASGTVSYTVQQAMQDPNSPTNPVLPYQVAWINISDPNMVNASATAQSTYVSTPTFAKVTLNNGSGSVTAIFAQAGVVPF
jgi:hypothetical protein